MKPDMIRKPLAFALALCLLLAACALAEDAPKPIEVLEASVPSRIITIKQEEKLLPLSSILSFEFVEEG